jgi:hypothetical protein
MLACYFAVFVSMQKTSKRLQQSAIACLELISTSDLEIEFHEIETLIRRSKVLIALFSTFDLMFVLVATKLFRRSKVSIML